MSATSGAGAPWESPEFCEREYNVRAAITNHQAFSDRWEAASRVAREGFGIELDVAFGPSAVEKLDIFQAFGDSRAVLVFIHGGYWQARYKETFSFLAPALREAGVTVVVPNYALAPAVRMGEIVRQAREAVAWTWRNAAQFGGDASRVYVCGHSAGGHLTAMVMATDWPWFANGLPAGMVKGGLAISGLFELAPLSRSSINDALGLTLEEMQRYSPARLAPGSASPLHVAVGGLESSEFHRQCTLLPPHWREVLRETLVVPGAHHLGVLDALADSSNVLHRRVLAMMGLA